MGEAGGIHHRLVAEIEDEFEGSLGLSVVPIVPVRGGIAWRARLPDSTLRAALIVAGTYFLIFVALPLLALGGGWPPASSALWPLAILQLYGMFWCGTSTAATRSTSVSILRIIKWEIVPFLSEASAERLLEILHKPSYHRSTQLRIAWTIGVAAAAFAAFLVRQDLARAGVDAPSTIALIWWSVGWALLYATAAKVVLVSRICIWFGDVLSDQPERLSPLNPAQSPLVTSLLALTKRMLLFWAGMALAIALVIPFALAVWGYGEPFAGPAWHSTVGEAVADVRRLHPSAFGFVLVHFVLTTIMSIGGGTLILIKSDAAARSAARRATARVLRALDERANAIADAPLTEESLKRLAELKALHSDIAARGSHRGLIVGAVGLLLPFAPLLALLLSVLSG
jgi:hypothetical protein